MLTTDTLPAPEIVAWLVRRFGIDPGMIQALPPGEANHTWRIGDDLVLRIPRDDRALTDDLRKERLVIPIAQSAGISTPEIVAFEDGIDRTGRPVMVLRRVAGTDPERAGLSEAVSIPIYGEVGRQIARLHMATGVGFAAPAGIPRDDGGDDPRSLLDPLVTAEALDQQTAIWLRDWFDRLAPYIPEAPAPVLIHGDVAPRNLIVDPASGALRALIDWGDATLADPAMDFAKLPLAMLPAVLAGYLGAEDHDGTVFRVWQARAFRYQLHWAVAATGRRDPVSGSLRPPGPAMQRLMVILRFLIETKDPRWDWLRQRPGAYGPAPVVEKSSMM